MPEIPEVEAFKSYVKSHCMNKSIADISISASKIIHGISPATFKKTLIDNKFTHIERKGKFLIIKLAKADKYLVMHFGLTGSVRSTQEGDKVRFSAVRFIFKNHTVLHFKSIRKFEKIWLVSDPDKIKTLRTMGPDALKLTLKEFKAILTKNGSKNIKAVLMDQDKIAGIGNEYADEILFQAHIDPHHSVKQLSSAQLGSIYRHMKSVLRYATSVQKKAIKKASSGEFFSKENRKMFKSSYIQAHRHIDMICPKNRTHRLKTATIAGRTTYYCPIDQQ